MLYCNYVKCLYVQSTIDQSSYFSSMYTSGSSTSIVILPWNYLGNILHNSFPHLILMTINNCNIVLSSYSPTNRPVSWCALWYKLTTEQTADIFFLVMQKLQIIINKSNHAFMKFNKFFSYFFPSSSLVSCMM